MFLNFFYLLRRRGLNVSPDQWMVLMDALNQGLCNASLISFYHLCRSILVKSEEEFDAFDLAFAEYFEDVETPDQIPEEVLAWLTEKLEWDPSRELEHGEYDLDELRRKLSERLEEQKERHDGGSYWVGTGGTSTMGHSGYLDQGIRVDGESRRRRAVQVAQERRFRDFRGDNVLDTRQFQMALRKLRHYSSRVDAAKTELDIDATIRETSDHGGSLRLVWERPRKNTVKLLLLFDSDGSMLMYSKLCSQLFQAVSKSSHFKDVQIYYFHNCVYEHLHTTPYCRRGEWVDTEWVFRRLNGDYRLIFIGDAAMSPSELLRKGGNSIIGLYNHIAGIEWLSRMKKQYPRHIWLNPVPTGSWENAYGSTTIQMIRDLIPMYELTPDGLGAGIKKLLGR